MVVGVRRFERTPVFEAPNMLARMLPTIPVASLTLGVVGVGRIERTEAPATLARMLPPTPVTPLTLAVVGVGRTERTPIFDAPEIPAKILPTIAAASLTRKLTMPSPWLTAILRSCKLVAVGTTAVKPEAAARTVETRGLASEGEGTWATMLVSSFNRAPAMFEIAPSRPSAIGDMAFASAAS